MDYVKAFSKGLFSSPGNNLMPYPYSPDMRNMRIDNGVMTVRKGYRNIVRSNLYTEVSGIASNNGNLYTIVNGRLKSMDFTTGVYTDIAALPEIARTSTLTFGKYTFFFFDNQPYVYDGTTLSMVTTFPGGAIGATTFTGTGVNDMFTSGYNIDASGHTYDVEITATGGSNDTYKYRIDGGAYVTGQLCRTVAFKNPLGSFGPSVYFGANTGHTIGDKWSFTTQALSTGAHARFGVVFAGETLVAGGNSGANSKRNIIYISVPIGNNPANSYDWTGSGSVQLVRKSDVLALAATMDRLFIFEEKLIESMTTASFTASQNGSSTPTATPLATGEAVPSNGSVIVAGDKLFFLTKGKRIKSVNYVLGVDQTEIGDVSNTADIGITRLLDEQLNDDLSTTVGFYDETNKHCKWFVRSRNSTVNDLVIIYDLVNSTFLVDNNKFYSCITRHSDGGYYAGGSLNTDLYQDEYGQDDDGGEISWYRYTAPLDNEKPWQNKLISEVSTTGTIDSTTVIKKEVFVDNDSVDTSYISKEAPVLELGIGASPIGIRPIGEQPHPESIVRFTKRRGAEYINSIGKFLQIKYSGSGVGQNFTLETIHTKEKVTEYREFDDV